MCSPPCLLLLLSLLLVCFNWFGLLSSYQAYPSILNPHPSPIVTWSSAPIKSPTNVFVSLVCSLQLIFCAFFLSHLSFLSWSSTFGCGRVKWHSHQTSCNLNVSSSAHELFASMFESLACHNSVMSMWPVVYLAYDVGPLRILALDFVSSLTTSWLARALQNLKNKNEVYFLSCTSGLCLDWMSSVFSYLSLRALYLLSTLFPTSTPERVPWIFSKSIFVSSSSLVAS